MFPHYLLQTVMLMFAIENDYIHCRELIPAHNTFQLYLNKSFYKVKNMGQGFSSAVYTPAWQAQDEFDPQCQKHINR